MMTEEPAAVDPANGEMVSTTPSRAAFLSTSTADFHPPDWACMPIEANMHARLEAFRDTRHCATYMVSTKLVNVFGRDQENCDHVLGNPSISRKHAAIIHDATGGIYLVDLMSRHGTYVRGKKIPPHDPFLLHDGDVIKFGQSIRIYSLKGATAEGASAPVKKSWGRKLKAPKVSISAVLPKISHAKPRKYSPAIVKLVSEICYGNMTDEKMDTFINVVMELSDEEKKDTADLLVEKVHAKYEFYAAHVHRNAYYTTVTLLKHNMLVEEFDSNLSLITQLSQQRHDSIYRTNARKILQILAAVRVDPENVHSPLSNSYSVNDSDSHASADDVNACPPTTNHMGTRDRVLSDEGKRLFLAGHGYAPPAGATAGPGHQHAGGATEEEYGMPHQKRQGSYGSTQYGDDDDDTASQASSYQPPPAPWQNGSYRQPAYPANGSANGYNNPPHNQYEQQSQQQQQQPAPSAFGFMGRSAAAAPVAHPSSGSAFGFISSAAPDDDDHDDEEDDDEAGRPSATGFDFIGQNGHPPPASSPAPPRVRAEEFLVLDPTIEKDEFDDMWESTNDSEEWAVEVFESFEPIDLQTCLERSRIKLVSSDKVSGMQRLLFCAEQQSKETIFLVEIMLMPGLSEITVTFKWIVNSLLYENGHDLFIELFKFVVDPFCDHEQHEQASQSYTGSRATTTATTTGGGGGRDDDDELEMIPVLDYLTENPSIEPAKFEQLWAGATVIGTVSCTWSRIPDKDVVIEVFHENRLGCLASGTVQNFIKFFFHGEMLELDCLFCMEVVVDTQSGAVTSTVKRYAFQPRIQEEEEQIDLSFVDFLDKLVASL